MSNFKQLLELEGEAQKALLAEANALLEPMTPQQRVAWALENLPDTAFLSSSFGIQAAVMLHLVSTEKSDIPVVLTDTGYLFPETYQFVDYLTERLDLNLKVYRSPMSPAWQEAKYGKLWEQGQEGIKHYNTLNKVEPMTRAIEEIGAKTWFSGLRRDQASSRADKQVLEISRGTVKVYPIIEWSNRDVYMYLTKHDLPYHPLWDEGYVSMGDVHTTRKLEPGMTEEETRFFGLNRECGLHIDGDGI
ncbi:phosphoadenosine phosphosulfate reductase [Pseudoalteromonas phenolica]|uniref:Phosphoadenosine 5'-phosphosulfate reductase n=1 Tax=Pseudoalteromonas phenolica TaxID=161398 RepID=A0A4Q7IHP1_9GAMM|nr:phosphoadenylyl-sulfate reductase [Pseudoalteromonas phenolica]RZQ51573.1 phosphoadenosine phosphosulfate reductase [Pseudoalteromonas phenolica]